ncbi:MAG: FAD-dependent monooxygenase, partial [Parvibaculaceae bacterium]|nr:FAD-dependent monooxygenase [Parvibaculaceae bacterium]
MINQIKSAKPKQTERDVVIVGGGLAGLPLALALSAHGVSVSVIDVVDPTTATDAAFDGRISSIALASSRMLQQLGVWSDLEAHAQPIADIVVTDGKVREGASPFFLHFDHQDIGDEPLGYMIENRHVRLALLKALERAVENGEPLELLAPAKVLSLNLKSAQPVVTLADGSELVADLCVAADGRGSMVRGWAEVKTIGWDYDQLGIVT